jgi:hypothetical protein
LNEIFGMVAMAKFFSTFRWCDFLRFLICCYPHAKLPEIIKKTFVAICSRFFVYWPD